MPFIPLDAQAFPESPVLFIFGGFLITALLVATVLSFYSTRKMRAQGKIGSGGYFKTLGLGLGTVIASVAISLLSTIPPAPNSIRAVEMKLNAIEDRAPEIQKEIRSIYGVELTRNEVGDLAYPLEKPTEDFRVYGSFDQKKQVEGAQFEKRTVYLVWVDGEFQLSESSDGEAFTPLEMAQ